MSNISPYLCTDAYSSGEQRWGTAVAAATVKPPASIRPTVSLATTGVVEGSPITFTPHLKYPYSRDLRLCSSTSDGTATVATGDYTAIPKTCLTVPAWSTTGPAITVPTLVDHVAEPSESVRLSIWGDTTLIVGNIKTAAGVIKTNRT